MKTLKLSLCLSAFWFAANVASALIVGPYTPDASTLYLFHFDGPTGSTSITNVGLKGGISYGVSEATASATPPVENNLLGYPGYSTNSTTFGNCMSNSTTGYEFGYDANNSGAYQGDVSSSSLSPDAILLSNLNIGNGGQTPFTLEALVAPQAIVSGINQEVICTDNSSGSARGFQFRITTGGQLQFSTINPSGQSVSANIPTTGANAFVANNWYHVAVTYDGTTLRLYWTKLDPSITAANQIGSANAAIGTAFGAISSPLIIGNENRNTAGELFSGQIDEVRISSVARGANQMQFFSPLVTIGTSPAPQNIDDGQPVTFTVSATSLTALGYQWRFNQTPINGATNTSYSIPAVSGLNAGNYDVVVTNTAASSATSAPALLVVGAANYLAHRYSFVTDDTDSIGGANGTNMGNATVSGGALVLDGSTGTYMQLPGGLLNGLTAFTVDTWLTMGVNGNNNRIFDFGNTNGVLLGVPGQPQNYVFFSPHTGTNQNMGISSGDTTFQQNLAVPGLTLDSMTVHVTCVIDPPDGQMSIYTNGVLEAVDTNLTVSLASVNDLVSYVGRSMFSALNGDAYLTGSIDEFRIYNGALDANSVLQSQIQGANTLLNDGPVQLVTQPGSTTTAPGLTVNLSGLATGNFPIAYQWFENGSAILGATNNNYLFSATVGQSGHNFQLFASNSITGTNYAVISTNATLTVVTPPTLVWLGANGSAWDTTTLNWTNMSNNSLVAYGLLDTAIFNDLGSAQSTVDLKQSLNPLALNVNSAANYTFISSAANGALSGSGSLTKSNNNTLVIDVTNTMSGPVLIAGGTLQIGNNDTLGAIGNVVTDNASLVLDRSDATVLPSSISGTGNVTMNSGNVTASGTNSYTGTTTINNGITTLTSATGLGATNGGVIVNNGELYVTANVDIPGKPFTLAGSGISSAGALRKGGSGITAIYGPVTLTANTTLNVDTGATLNLTNAAGINGAAVNANLTLIGAGAGNIAAPLLLGSGNLTVSGGTWTVAPTNSFSGLSTVTAGSLRLTAAGSLGPVPASPNPSQVTLGSATPSVGTLEAANSLALNDGNIGIFLAGSGTLAADTNAVFTITDPISSVSGSVVLTKTGPGTVILNGANPFNGTLDVDSGQTSAGNDGMLVIANNAAIANIIAFPGLPFINIHNENAATSTLGLDGTSGSLNIGPDITLNGRNNTVPAIENLAGNNTISGGITLGVGGGVYAFQSDSGTLTLSANLPETTPPSSGRSLTFQGASIVAVTGSIVDGVNNGASNVWDNVIVAGPGLLNLSAANTYSGFTGVSNGVLSLTGSINSLAGVTVSGGLLVGNGSINGPVTTRSTGGLEAGATNAIGTLTLASSLTLGGNTIVKINKTGSTSDQFVGQTAITYGGTLTVTNLAGTLVLGDHFTLFNPGASASNFSSIAGSAGTGLGYSFTNGVLTVVQGTANNPTNLTFSVSGGSLTVSWPADHLGWILQSQTNSLTTGLGTNWVDMSGSSSVTQENMSIITANPTVFYRLRHP